jgi:hypothetical protein
MLPASVMSAPPLGVVRLIAVLQPVIRDPRHTPFLIEIDDEHALIDHFGFEEGGALGFLRNVIEGFARNGRDRGGGAEHEQHLLLARADRNLFQRPLVEHVAAMLRLGETVDRERAAAGHRQNEPKRGKRRRTADKSSWQRPKVHDG